MAKELAQIQSMIYEIRGQKVMLDRDLAELYRVELKAMNQAVKRNTERFPSDFMFQLTDEEWSNLRSQIVTANKNVSKVRFPPYVFTEHGVLMLSNVLNSENAVNMSIQTIRVFDKLRKFAITQTTKDIRIDELHKLLCTSRASGVYNKFPYARRPLGRLCFTSKTQTANFPNKTK
jgi:hypothetical protein